MSEFRSSLFPGGVCAGEQSQLFDRLDDGRRTARGIALAKEACAACPQFIDCVSNLGLTALSLAQHGVETSVIGGLDLQLRKSLGMRERMRPAEMRANFLEPRTSLEGVRGLMLTGQRMRFARALTMDLPQVDTLESYEAYARLSPEQALKAQKTLNCAFRFTRDFLQVGGSPYWNLIPEHVRFRSLAEAYLPEVIALEHMDITDPTWSALLLPSQEYRKIQLRYGHLGSGVLKRTYDKADCWERLERATQRMEWAKREYNPAPTKLTILLAIGDTLATSSHDTFKVRLEAHLDKQRAFDTVRKERSDRIRLATERYQEDTYVTEQIIGRYAKRTAAGTTQNFMDQLEAYRDRCEQIEEFTRVQLTTSADISRFVSHFAEQENGIEKAHEFLDNLATLCEKYSFRPRRLVYCIGHYTLNIPNIETKIQRYKKNLSMLAPLLREPSIPNVFVDECAFRNARDPVAGIKKYYERLALLEQEFRNDDDFDDMVLSNLATRISNDVLRQAHKYKELYHTLRIQYENDDYVEDWMIRVAATNYKSPHHKLKQLRLALQKGYLRLSIDRPLVADLTLTFADTITDHQNPEDDYIQQENSREHRVHISGAITALSPPERQALCIAFDLGWLVKDEELDLPDVCAQLGIKAAELEGYVKKVIIPKIDAEQLKGLR